MVAIPAVWAFNAVSQRIARLLMAVECAGEEYAVEALTGTRAEPTPRASTRAR
jgi:hypothetical protein